jgi:hypothetical protein
MTTPEAGNPQPRDIALEQETPELAEDLEAQSEPEPEKSWPRHRVHTPHEP